MLTWETIVEAQALYARGWSKSAIARHLGINRRTVREYLRGDRVPGRRVPAGPEVFGPFAEYARLRLTDDPHLWGSTLFDELTALGYPGVNRRSPGRCGGGGCGRIASRARPAGAGSMR